MDETLAAAVGGDVEAIGALYEKYVGEIERFVRAHIYDPEIAEDIVSQVFTDVVRHIRQYEDRGYAFSAWLYRIARSRMIDARRLSARRQHVPLHEWGAAADGPETGADAVERAAVRAALLLLTPKQRAVVEARFLLDRPIDEVAAQIVADPGVVKALQHRGIEALRRQLERPHLPRTMREHERAWSEDDTERIRLGVERGWSDAAIAHWLGRTAVAIKVKRKREGISRRGVKSVATATEVANMLGVKCNKTVMRWAELGWLPFSRSSDEKGAVWRFLWSDVWAFCEKAAYWMAWHPERIADSARRSWALALRRGQPRWLTPGEVARRYHVARNVPTSWIAKGELAATRYGNWWIWEADLNGWTPPGERKRLIRRRPTPTDEPGWLSMGAVSSRFSVNRCTPTRWIRAGLIPGVRKGRSWWVHARDLEGWDPPSNTPAAAARARSDRAKAQAAAASASTSAA